MLKTTRRLSVAVVLASVAALAGAGIADAAAAPAAAGQGSTCTRPGLLFCADFDDLPTGGAATLQWGVDTRNGTLTVQRGGPGRGGKVLHVRTRDNGRAFLRVDDLAVPGGQIFGRMRLRVDDFPTAPDWAHFTLVEATGTGSAEVVRPVGGQYVPTLGRSLWGIGADGGPTGDWTAWRESAPVVRDTWQCFEWVLDRTDNRVAVWIDGVANPELTASTTAHGGNPVPFVLPAVTTVKIGWQLYQAGTSPGQFDLWLDDVALSDRRLGC